MSKDAGSEESAPPAYKVVGVQLGSAVSKAVASNALSSVAVRTLTETGATAATAATLVSRAQLQSLGLIALRVPLASAERMERFTAAIAAFTLENEASLAKIAEMTTAQQILTVGFQSNLLGILATAAVQQSIAVAYLAAGWSSPQQFRQDSVSVALAGAGSLAGGISGAAVGTLVVPGAGTAIGSLLGSFGGAYLPQVLLAGPAAEQLRPLRCIEREDDWLEVVDCTGLSESSFHMVTIPAMALDAPHDDTCLDMGPTDVVLLLKMRESAPAITELD